jgi:choline kinase
MPEDMAIVLLVAGRGTRLGGDLPKCLTKLTPDGVTILDHQLRGVAGLTARPVTAVVGHMREMVRATHPELNVVVNERYADTNTAKSLLCALEHLSGADILWLNGDVVFDPRILPLILGCRDSCMAVNRAVCGEEEIKYRTDASGRMIEVSKTVVHGEGEAVGINLVREADFGLFKRCLARCADRDYFERGLELAIQEGMQLYPVDIGELPCVEIDFPEDLERAKKMLKCSMPNTQHSTRK